jgi:hypothetical protein
VRQDHLALHRVRLRAVSLLSIPEDLPPLTIRHLSRKCHKSLYGTSHESLQKRRIGLLPPMDTATVTAIRVRTNRLCKLWLWVGLPQTLLAPHRPRVLLRLLVKVHRRHTWLTPTACDTRGLSSKNASPIQLLLPMAQMGPLRKSHQRVSILSTRTLLRNHSLSHK